MTTPMGVPGEDITIYEADERMGGGFFLGGSAESGYNLPGSVFDNEFRCAFELLKSIPSASNASISVTDEFFAFNTGEPYHEAHIFDRDGRIVHGPRFGLTSLGRGSPSWTTTLPDRSSGPTVGLGPPHQCP